MPRTAHVKPSISDRVRERKAVLAAVMPNPFVVVRDILGGAQKDAKSLGRLLDTYVASDNRHGDACRMLALAEQIREDIKRMLEIEEG